MATAYLMVRSILAEATDRPRFDRWYATEHMPQAIAAFAARRGWRCWSRTNPNVHRAFYEFADVATADAVLHSPEIAVLIAEYDRVWGARVIRTRDVLELAD